MPPITALSMVVGVGGVGALTTFSTLADDIRELSVAEQAQPAAAAYLVATLILGLGAAAAGLAAAG